MSYFVPLASLAILLISAVAGHYYPIYEEAKRKVAHLPGFRSAISPMSGAGFGTPYIPGIYPGFDMPWKGKHKLFAKFKSDVISCVSWGGAHIIYLADGDLVKKVNSNQGEFPKPVEEYDVLNFFGPNLVTAKGKDWVRQHAVSKDVFNTQGWKLLWKETHDIFTSMMTSNGWDKLPAGAEVPVKHAVDVTLRVALLAIANAGFGMKMGWVDDLDTILPPGHTLSFQNALHTVAQSSILRLGLPNFLFNWLPFPRIRHIRTAFKELRMYIETMIDDREASLFANKEAVNEEDERADLFHNLVKSSLSGEQPLTKDELIGNIYIYLLAGHETTAHSIAFTLALLSLWPEKQEKLYQHIMEVMPKDGITTYDHYAKFDYVQAVYFETLRMFPPVQQIPKKVSDLKYFVHERSNEQYTTAEQDVPNNTLPVPGQMTRSVSRDHLARPSKSDIKTPAEMKKMSLAPDQVSNPIDADTIVFVCPPAVHYNPKYYPNPYDFQPERFMGDFDTTNFIPFSSGTRICLGKHFSEVESVCFLAYLMRDFEVHPIPAFEGETKEQMKERMFEAIPLITLTPLHIPITLKRRAH